MLHEREILDFLQIPKIPKKEWDGTKEFKNGVGIAKTISGVETYVVVCCDEQGLKIKKVFDTEPIVGVGKVFVVPDYMDMKNIENWDLDDESKKAAVSLANEAIEMESSVEEKEENLPEWYFDEIHDIDEARAWVSQYRKKRKMRGTMPKTEEALKNFLYVCYKNKKRGI